MGYVEQRCGRSATLRPQELGCDKKLNLAADRKGISCGNEVEGVGSKANRTVRARGSRVRVKCVGRGTARTGVTYWRTSRGRRCTQAHNSVARRSETVTVEMVYGGRFRGYRASIVTVARVVFRCDSTWQGWIHRNGPQNAGSSDYRACHYPTTRVLTDCGLMLTVSIGIIPFSSLVSISLLRTVFV